MEVSGQLHGTADLPLGKEQLVPIGFEAGWASQQLQRKEKYLPEINP
jgi:hypothetical protein